MLRKLVNTNKAEELVKIMREIYRFTVSEDVEKGLVTKAILDKVRKFQHNGGDLGVRSRLLLNKWEIADGRQVENNLQKESRKDQQCIECTECGSKYLNKANLKRHTQAVHENSKRMRTEESFEPRVTRARGK